MSRGAALRGVIPNPMQPGGGGGGGPATQPLPAPWLANTVGFRSDNAFRFKHPFASSFIPTPFCSFIGWERLLGGETLLR